MTNALLLEPESADMQNQRTQQRRHQQRQGDVLIVPVDTLPPEAKPAERDEIGRIVLALGEASGHAHAIRDQDVVAFRMETAEADVNRALVDYVLVGGSGASLAHEYESGKKAEHDTLNLAPGAYRVVQQREYSPEELLRVAD